MSDDNSNRIEWGFLEDDSKEFGLTLDEYNILLDDLAQAIEDGNRKYGYGGAGYNGKDGNYYLPEYNDKYVNHTHNQKQVQRKKPRRSSVEEVAIARGIIKILQPTANEVKS